MPVGMTPRLEMIADKDGIHPHGFRLTAECQQFAGGELLRGRYKPRLGFTGWIELIKIVAEKTLGDKKPAII